MLLEWTWWAVPAVLAVVFGWTVAAFIYFARPGRAQNRCLALFVALGSSYVGVGNGGILLAADEGAARAFASFSFVGPVALVFYLLFLGTLETPLVRPLRSRMVRAVLLAGAAVPPALYFWRREGFVGALTVQDGRFTMVSGPVDVAFNLLALVLFLYGFVVALSAWRRAPSGSASRQRAAAYAVAFGVRDAGYVTLLATFLTLVAVRPEDTELGVASSVLAPCVEIVYLPLLVYGIAKTSLFDIDLKIKWTVRRGTLAAAFVGVFVVVSQVAQNVLSDALGLVVGGVATGMLLLALGPLQRAADRVADAAVPRATGTSEYVAFRKLEVYKAAVESAAETGGIDARERATLDRMREKLGIRQEDALAVEADVFARHSTATAA